MKLDFEKEQFDIRHIGPDAKEVSEMLKAIGVSSVDELIDQTIPKKIRSQKPLDLDEPLTEHEYLDKIERIGKKNKIFRNYIGMGYYNCFTPSVILRNVMENPGWYTPYTPYQSEIAQGRLEGLLNFQTMVMDLTGMPIANSSLLDEATAAAEAMAMLYSKKKNKTATKFFVSDKTYNQTADVLKTRAEHFGIEIVLGDLQTFVPTDEYFAALVQYPDANGEVKNFKKLRADLDKVGAYLIVAADLMSLVLLTPPSEFGADVVVGTTQRFGIPLGFGGPHAAYFATKDEFKRIIPGRIIGVSLDSNGNPALRMALQTREQHIRRDKATSNICTAQALLANMAAFYAIYHGSVGLKRIATRIHSFASLVNDAVTGFGYTQLNTIYFDTIKFDLKGAGVSVKDLRKVAEKHEINLCYFKDGTVGASLDETSNGPQTLELIQVFAEAAGKKYTIEEYKITYAKASGVLRKEHLRSDEVLTHEVFNTHHSETEMMRYLKYLENKDLGLNTSMIPLGSCTMKLNAATEMIPVTWPEFSALHPFAPEDQTKGYYEVFKELNHALCEITGFAEISLQPNAGAQGEYAGLLVIKEYLRSKGEGDRNVCLIPASAHGTNPASAVMAGMKVVVVKCDEMGNIDMTDLTTKTELHKDKLAALMITYPSTHGVFEDSVVDVCNLIHEHGGQVYMDGANMNAQVGLTSPAIIGADVCHLNLHKTFCIPHGGGGPGMGPIGVAKHLAPFLPTHSIIKTGGEKGISAISAAPFSSSSILLISHAYIMMMGSEGLTNATRMAIINANYIAARLKGHFNILYTGENGRIAHEMIIDCRSFKQSANVEVEDIAKRLMDYGFHAPTVSFPVVGTLMIEPTESEDKGEIDRYCDALISIREEIKAIETGTIDKEDNLLKNAPHTQEFITSDSWDKPYTRQEAAFPLTWLAQHKFWPSVARIDNTYGDRNLVCSCLPLSEYSDERELEVI